jgi:hypothetical protein
VLAGIRSDDQAKASGTNATIRQIGVALGVAVLTAVFTGNGGQLTPTGYVDAARPAVLVGALVVLGSAVVAVFLPVGKTHRNVSDETDNAGTAPAAIQPPAV